MAGANDGMTGKQYLVGRSEDIHLRNSILIGRMQEDSLREVELPGDLLLLLLRQLDIVDFYNGDRVAFESISSDQPPLAIG
jgi:hypothetical protein